MNYRYEKSHCKIREDLQAKEVVLKLPGIFKSIKTNATESVSLELGRITTYATYKKKIKEENQTLNTTSSKSLTMGVYL